MISPHFFLHILFAMYIFAIICFTFYIASNTYRDIHNKKMYDNNNLLGNIFLSSYQKQRRA